MWKEILIKGQRAGKTPRLTYKERNKILHIMSDGEWRTVAELVELVGSNSRRIAMFIKHNTAPGTNRESFESMNDPSIRESKGPRKLWRLRREYWKD